MVADQCVNCGLSVIVMVELEHILDKVKLRPGMYIGWHSIYSLKTFISGYEQALYENLDLKPDERVSFGHWVEFKYKINNSFWPWSRILHHVAGTEDKALDLFFELWPQYLKERDTFKSSEIRLSFSYPKESVTNDILEKFHASRKST